LKGKFILSCTLKAFHNTDGSLDIVFTLLYRNYQPAAAGSVLGFIKCTAKKLQCVYITTEWGPMDFWVKFVDHLGYTIKLGILIQIK
jgi:hypothetical protein